MSRVRATLVIEYDAFTDHYPEAAQGSAQALAKYDAAVDVVALIDAAESVEVTEAEFV